MELIVVIYMVELTLDISEAVVEELYVERHGEDEVRFDVGGVVTDVDADKLQRALTAEGVEPVSLTIETGYDENSASD